MLSNRSALVGQRLLEAAESQKIELSGVEPAPTVPGLPAMVTTTESPIVGLEVLTEIEVTLLADAARTRVTLENSYRHFALPESAIVEVPFGYPL